MAGRRSAFRVYKEQEKTTSDSSFSASNSSIEGGLSVSMQNVLENDLMQRKLQKSSRQHDSRKRKRRNDERTPVQKQLEAILVRKYLNRDAEASPILAGSADMVALGARNSSDTNELQHQNEAKKNRLSNRDETGKQNFGQTKEKEANRKKVQGSKQGRGVRLGPAAKQAVSSRKVSKESRMGGKAMGDSDSRVQAKKMFEWMISPVRVKKFFRLFHLSVDSQVTVCVLILHRELWEQKPLLVRRHQSQYYSSIFSIKELDRILREENLDFSVNIDITMYKDGRRETLNPDGRAHAAVVWDYYQQGCSVRLLNPQTYSRSVWKLNSTLQQFFNSCVGANIYLTPSGSQGFAPHYDDIEAFVLQLEGRKHWKLYKPRSEGEVLPRYSSSNFNEDEIGSPVLDVVLEPGDMLYFPRGFIHQAKSVPDLHSLHITVSACQKNTWGDLLEKLAPAALKLALEEDVEFRKALPRDYLEYVGITYSDKKSSKRSEFMHHVEYLMSKLFSFAPVDAAVDQMVGDFLHSSLPPFLTKAQSSCTIHGSGPRWMSSGVLSASPLLTKDVKICLLQQGIARLVMEDDELRLYHTVDNSRVYHGKERQFIEVTEEEAMAFEYLLQQYPNYVLVSSLPLDSDDSKVEFASFLFHRGLLITDRRLDDESV